MAAGSGALNLSLLSRGVGEVKRNGSERVDVIFEPQDYFNFVEESHDRPFFLPPLQPRYGFSDGSQVSSRFTGPKEPRNLPKTFTTRKGALLLFSEDMASKTKQEAGYKKHKTFDYQSKDQTLSTMTASSLDNDLKTVDDLAKSILAYGSIDESGKMNLKFLKQRRKYEFDRQIRPGFSAKRYLSTWAKNWDDNVLEKVISKGYLTEKSLFYYNPLLPHLQRRLNDDMSHYPSPYRLMRSMLMSPGSLSGYTFYRVRPESQETDYIEILEEDDVAQTRSGGGKSALDRSVKLLTATAEGGQKEINYGHLDSREQKEVLTDLLVKSAVHYALKKQQEYVLDANRIDEEGSEYNPMPKFDMKDAVETMLSDNDKKSMSANVVEPHLPERDDRSQHSGSFKGSKLGQPGRPHQNLKERGSSEALHGVQSRDESRLSVSPDALPPLSSGPPVLPPIGQGYTQLTPIGEASREHTALYSLPVDKDDNEEEKWAGQGMTEKEHQVPRPPKEPLEERRRRDSDKRKSTRIPQQSLDLEGPVITGGANIMSSSESLGPGSTQSSALGWHHRQPQWKGSTQSLRSQGSRKASGSLVDGDQGSSNRGSIIFGPDGAVIKVGEAIKLSARAPDSVQDVHDANMYPTGLRDASDDSDGEMPDEWKQRRRHISGRQSGSLQRLNRKDSTTSNVTEQEIIDTLTSHASRIAESVLSQSDGGQMLEEDIRRAAALWMDTHPAREISRSQSVQDLPDKTIIQDVMQAQKRRSAGPTVAEYRDKIKGNLMTAIAKATGLNQEDIPADAEIDPELLEQLSSSELTLGDIEIVKDEETGRSYIRSRNRQISEAMGGVEKGHIYQAGGKNDASKRISIPERSQNVDIGELDVIKYGEADKQSQKSPSEKAGSEVGSKKGSMSGPHSLVAGSLPDDAAGTKTPKSGVSFKSKTDAEEFQKAIDDLEKSSLKKSEGDAVSEKSDDKKSKVSEKSKKKEEFVVAGPIDHTKENTKIYPGLPPAQPTSPRKPKSKPKAPAKDKVAKKPAKKGKGKAKKKEEEAPEPETAIEAVSPVKDRTPEPVPPPKEPTPPPPPEPEPSEPDFESPKPDESEDEEDYIIVRDQSFSPEPESVTRANITTSPEEEPEDEQVSQDDNDEDMSEADKLRLISNREARAAKRAAAAEKRRQEVEKKRREREEQLKREKEEHERQDKLKNELEEQRRKKEEERRLRKQQEEDENQAAAREEMEQQKRAQAEAEKERRRKEEYARKLEEMKRKQAEDEKRRKEEAERKLLEEEERRKQEEELMAQMEEEERLEYERKKKEEEELRKIKEEEERRQRELEAQRALEEARRLAEEMARRQAELEARLRFNRSLQLESNGLEHTQDITKAFVFSYFELLQWLGLDIPEFDLLKLNQY